MNRRSRLLVEHVDVLRGAFQHIRQRHTFTLDAIVILPDHLHCIWTLPDGYVARPIDWPYSSFHRYVARGVYPASWCTCEVSPVIGGES